MDYYRRVIEFCADWELNALQFRIADDQGCAVRLSSVPDLLFHEHAFPPEQLNELARYARSHGVDLIPELESFGHTGYITRAAAYAHLLDADPRASSEFTGVIPVHAETLELFNKLYREISGIFPSLYLHGGCDEVNWGGSALSRKALETKQRYEIWADYLNSLNRIVEGVGKQFVVWGDVVLHKEPKVLDRLSKNIIVMDWNYVEKNPVKLQATLSQVRKNGFRGIGAPALINYRWGARAGTDQLANIDAFAGAYLANEDSASLGVILTNWVPCRYLQNSIWDGFAYAAVSFKEGSSIAHNDGFRRFVEKHYQASWNKDWEQAFRLIYEFAPEAGGRPVAAGTVPLRVPWSGDGLLSAVLKDRSSRSNPFTRLHAILMQLEKHVQKNLPDFQAFALSVAYLDQLYWREAILVEYAAKKPLTQQGADQTIKSIAARDRSMADALSKEWDRGRFSDSPAKREPLFGFEPKDELVFQFQRAADYSASLAARPDRFFRIVMASETESSIEKQHVGF
jgi:glycosyl hydrolase family 20